MLTLAPLQSSKIMHIVLKGGDPQNPLVYLISEDWKASMDTVLSALPSVEDLAETSPALARRVSVIIEKKSSLSASRSAPNLRRGTSTNKLRPAAVSIDYTKCLKSGYVEKRKFEDGYKWEKRYLLLTAGHLVWFKDKEARDREEVQNFIELRDVKEINVYGVPGDDTVPLAVHVVLEQVTYLFYDCTKSKYLLQQWCDQIVFAAKLVSPALKNR